MVDPKRRVKESGWVPKDRSILDSIPRSYPEGRPFEINLMFAVGSTDSDTSTATHRLTCVRCLRVYHRHSSGIRTIHLLRSSSIETCSLLSHLTVDSWFTPGPSQELKTPHTQARTAVVIRTVTRVSTVINLLYEAGITHESATQRSR